MSLMHLHLKTSIWKSESEVTSHSKRTQRIEMQTCWYVQAASCECVTMKVALSELVFKIQNNLKAGPDNTKNTKGALVEASIMAKFADLIDWPSLAQVTAPNFPL